MSGKKKVEALIDDDDADDEKKAEGGGDKGYSWEEEFKRSWEVVQEDDSGSLKSLVTTLQLQLKKRRYEFKSRPLFLLCYHLIPPRGFKILHVHNKVHIAPIFVVLTMLGLKAQTTP